MIKCETSPETGATAVTFTLTHSVPDGHHVAVVGDFNDWNPHATPMQARDGIRSATVTLAPGRYRFRYLGQDGAWFNDDAADFYEPNHHGGHDSILDLRATTRFDSDLPYPHDMLLPDLTGPELTGPELTGPGVTGPGTTGSGTAGPGTTGPDTGRDMTGPDMAHGEGDGFAAADLDGELERALEQDGSPTSGRSAEAPREPARRARKLRDREQALP